MQALLHHFRYICSFVVNDPFLPLVLPEAFQAVVETDGAVAQKEPHVAAHVGDEAAPLVGVVVDLLVEPGAQFNGKQLAGVLAGKMARDSVFD